MFTDSSICQRYPVQSFDQSQNCCLCQKFAHFWETEIGNHCHGQWHWPRRQRYRYQVLQTVGRLEKFPLGSGMLACILWSSGLTSSSKHPNCSLQRQLLKSMRFCHIWKVIFVTTDNSVPVLLSSCNYGDKYAKY